MNDLETLRNFNEKTYLDLIKDKKYTLRNYLEENEVPYKNHPELVSLLNDIDINREKILNLIEKKDLKISKFLIEEEKPKYNRELENALTLGLEPCKNDVENSEDSESSDSEFSSDDFETQRS